MIYSLLWDIKDSDFYQSFTPEALQGFGLFSFLSSWTEIGKKVLLNSEVDV